MVFFACRVALCAALLPLLASPSHAQASALSPPANVQASPSVPSAGVQPSAPSPPPDVQTPAPPPVAVPPVSTSVPIPSASELPPTGQTAPAPSTEASPIEPVADVPAAVPTGSFVTLLYRLAPEKMGDHNAVRVWINGDGSGSILRLRLLQTGGSLPDGNALPARPLWRSPALPVTWKGWKAVLVPKSNFAVRTPKAALTDTDMALPADSALTTTPPVPRFADADAVGLEVMTKKGVSLLVDDLSFVTIDATGAVQDELSVDDFEKGNVAAWLPAGSADARQALTYGVTTAPGAAHSGKVAFKIDVLAPDGSRAARLVPLTAALQMTGKPYLVWTPAGLFDTVLPSTLPAPAGTSSQVSLQMCADQTQAATFCIYSQKNLQNVTVSLPGDLLAPGHTLSRAFVNLHVVKVWSQQGLGPLRDPDSTQLVPEMLVKDDRVPFSGVAPALRLNGFPVTNIPAGTSKQFWVTVNVPRNTVPALYAANVSVSAKGLIAFPVRLEVNVLPLRLLSPAKQYGIGLRSRLDTPPAMLPSDDGKDLVTDFVDKAELDAQLTDISAHGFHIATLADSPATLWDALTEYQAHGISDSTTPFIYTGTGDPTEIEAARREHNAPPFLYYQGPPADAAAAAHMAAMAKSGMAVTAYVTRQADYDTLGTGLAVPVYSAGSEYAQGLLRSRGKRISASRDWWYWDASDENPALNRLNTGYLLWRANLYGAFVPAYQTAFGTDPYDDSSAGSMPGHAAFRPEMMTYPAVGGVVDTLQWEACREGINDTRYLTTMFAALRECKDAKIAGPLVATAEGYVKALLDKPLLSLTGAQLDAARPKIAAFAIQLRAAADAYNKKAPADPNAIFTVKKKPAVPAKKPAVKL